MKNSKNTQNEEVQDMIGILMANGHNLDRILGLGYVIPVEQDVKTMAIEKKQNLYKLNMHLHVVISEVLKSQGERNENKLVSFLKLAMNESDSYYNGLDPDNFLAHGLTPDFK